MSLNSQVKNTPTGGNRKFIFKDGVKFRHMTGKDPIVFRVLPSFDSRNPDPATSCLPYILPDGSITDWGYVLRISRFIGHGGGKFGSRNDLLSLQSFAQDGEEIFCPLNHLVKTISQMSGEWGYLLEDVKGPDGKSKEKAPFSRPLPHFICNIWDFNKPTAGAQLACFTSSAYNALFNEKNGLVFQRNNLPEEVLKQNYLLGYALTDLTDPTNGPALMLSKGNEQGEYSKYVITLAQDNYGKIIKRPLGSDILVQRYNMSRLGEFINIPTEEDLIQGLIELLNMRGPHGYHEWVLLKQAFPQYRIPEPPAAPAASPMVAMGGFGMNPAAGYPTPANPTIAYPAPVSYQTAQPMAPAAPIASYPTVSIPGMPPSVAPVTVSVPVPTVSVPVVTSVAATPPPATTSPEMKGIVANAMQTVAAPMVTPVTVQPSLGQQVNKEPVAPGDDVGGKHFDRNAFMTRLAGMGK